MLVTALAIASVRDLFAAVMLMGIYGLLSASFFVLMDAVDVAFTEASVGVGLVPLLMIYTLGMTRDVNREAKASPGSLALVSIAAALLFFGTLDMPAFGSADAPAHRHTAPRYLDESMTETGIPNVVTSVLASYRAYDTLGEVTVVFAAGVGVLALFFPGASSTLDAGNPSLRQYTVPRIIGKILIPPILIFALYVQFHGEYGPGGGFPAGAIFASALIMYAMLFGLQTLKRVVNHELIRVLAAAGVLLFGTVGVLGMASGGNFLDYDYLAADAKTGQHAGILLVELGVGITVASVMLLQFLAFADRKNAMENG